MRLARCGRDDRPILFPASCSVSSPSTRRLPVAALVARFSGMRSSGVSRPRRRSGGEPSSYEPSMVMRKSIGGPADSFHQPRILRCCSGQSTTSPHGWRRHRPHSRSVRILERVGDSGLPDPSHCSRSMAVGEPRANSLDSGSRRRCEAEQHHHRLVQPRGVLVTEVADLSAELRLR